MAKLLAGVAMSHSPMIMTNEEACWGKRTTIFFKQQRNEKMVKRKWCRDYCFDFR